MKKPKTEKMEFNKIIEIEKMYFRLEYNIIVSLAKIYHWIDENNNIYSSKKTVLNDLFKEIERFFRLLNYPKTCFPEFYERNFKTKTKKQIYLHSEPFYPCCFIEEITDIFIKHHESSIARHNEVIKKINSIENEKIQSIKKNFRKSRETHRNSLTRFKGIHQSIKKIKSLAEKKEINNKKSFIEYEKFKFELSNVRIKAISKFLNNQMTEMFFEKNLFQYDEREKMINELRNTLNNFKDRIEEIRKNKF